MNKVKIAILGMGTVGKGVWKILQTNASHISKSCDYEIEIEKVLVRDIYKDRGLGLPSGILTTNIEEIINNDEIKIVIELMHGCDEARDYIKKAINAKKHVVSANKYVIANWGDELFGLAEQQEVMLYYEASVGGGIPVIREINESLTGNKIKEIIGIINGTTNYILSKMTAEGVGYEEALKDAQLKGYSELDPTADVEGYDVVNKLAILSSLAFGAKVSPENVYREGINNIVTKDIEYAKKFGYLIKLLAVVKQIDGKLELRVSPTLVPKAHPIANVNDSFNAVFIKGDAIGDLMLYGRGAGDFPTGSAVVGDLISIVRNNMRFINFRLSRNYEKIKEFKKKSESVGEFYIRLNVKDKAGVLGHVATELRQNEVSIVSVTQDLEADETACVVFTTHKCLEKNIQNAIEEVKKFEDLNCVDSILRIENFEENKIF